MGIVPGEFPAVGSQTVIVQSRQYWDGGETELQAHGEICNPHGRCTVRGGDSSSKTGETFGITVSFSFLELGLRLHVHLDESGDIHQLVQPQDTHCSGAL